MTKLLIFNDLDQFIALFIFNQLPLSIKRINPQIMLCTS